MCIFTRTNQLLCFQINLYKWISNYHLKESLGSVREPDNLIWVKVHGPCGPAVRTTSTTTAMVERTPTVCTHLSQYNLRPKVTILECTSEIQMPNHPSSGSMRQQVDQHLVTSPLEDKLRLFSFCMGHPSTSYSSISMSLVLQTYLLYGQWDGIKHRMLTIPKTTLKI